MKKKIGFALLLLVCLFTFSTNVHAADITCTALGDAVIDESIVNLVHIIIRIIQIAVPILLVIFGMLDLARGMMSQKEDEIKKGQQVFIKRVIAAVLVFFVIAIVKFIISSVAGDSNSTIFDCVNCFIEGASAGSCG